MKSIGILYSLIRVECNNQEEEIKKLLLNNNLIDRKVIDSSTPKQLLDVFQEKSGAFPEYFCLTNRLYKILDQEFFKSNSKTSSQVSIDEDGIVYFYWNFKDGLKRENVLEGLLK